MYNYFNPYQQPYQQAQKQEVVKANGEAGARSYQMPPNSSALLLDTTAPIVWLVQTDGAGYRTATAYDITQHQEPQQADLMDLETRISRLEAMFSESNTQTNDKPKHQTRQSEKPDPK